MTPAGGGHFTRTKASIPSGMKLSALGDRAVLAYLTDEPAAVRFASAVRDANPPWLFDVVPAYASVGVFFDADRLCAADVMAWLNALSLPSGSRRREEVRSFTIPVCYEMQLDLPRVCEATGLSAND